MHIRAQGKICYFLLTVKISSLSVQEKHVIISEMIRDCEELGCTSHSVYWVLLADENLEFFSFSFSYSVRWKYVFGKIKPLNVFFWWCVMNYSEEYYREQRQSTKCYEPIIQKNEILQLYPPFSNILS